MKPLLKRFKVRALRFYSADVATAGRHAFRPPFTAVGQRADVFIEAGRKDSVCSVPPAAIDWKVESERKPTARLPGVFVNEGGRAKWKPVTLGLRNRTAVEVTDGLTLNEEVIVPIDSAKQLATGMRVTTR